MGGAADLPFNYNHIRLKPLTLCNGHLQLF